jgi:CheY-like chemotaxis protein
MTVATQSQKLRGILLVDDDEVTNFINSELINDLQVTDSLSICENGIEALTYLKKAHLGEAVVPDLIFLDLNMPEMNGTEFLEAYKKEFKETDTIIVMLSTSQIPEEVFQALMMTNLVVAFLEKPLTAEKIMDLVSGINRVYYHNCRETAVKVSSH